MKKINFRHAGFIVICAFIALAGCSKKAVVKEEPMQHHAQVTSPEYPKEVRLEGTQTGSSMKASESKAEEAKSAEESAEQASGQKAQQAEESQIALESVNFDFDKSDIRADAKAILEKDYKELEKYSTVKVQIEGHCDERGTNEYNIALGQRRADSVKKFLETMGIAADRMSTISYGEEKPLDPGHNEEAWAKNRRADFIVSR